MATDVVDEIVQLIINEIDYDSIFNTEDEDLEIDEIYTNPRLDNINSDHIHVYHVDEYKDYTSYFNRNKWDLIIKLAVQITARERNNITSGSIPLSGQVNRVFERFMNWKCVDGNAPFDKIYVINEVDLTDKRLNYSKRVINIEIQDIGVQRRTT